MGSAPALDISRPSATEIVERLGVTAPELLRMLSESCCRTVDLLSQRVIPARSFPAQPDPSHRCGAYPLYYASL